MKSSWVWMFLNTRKPRTSIKERKGGVFLLTDVMFALASFVALCVAWVAIGRRRSVRIVRINRGERAA
jgi:hypothetical protein